MVVMAEHLLLTAPQPPTQAAAVAGPTQAEQQGSVVLEAVAQEQ
jgi:hypothetical protein